MSSDIIEVTQMHKIVLDPKDPFKLWADDSVERVLPLHSRNPSKILGYSLRNAEESIKVANNVAFPCKPVAQPVGD
jgi:hypothetical protein